MMTLTFAVAQAQSISTSYVVIGMGLLILVIFLLMYFLIGNKNNGLPPINQLSINKAKRIFLPYTERFAKDIASGDKVFIQGKLNRKLQIGLKTILWLLYLAIIIKLIADMFGSEEHWYSSLILILLIGIQIIQSLKTAYVLIRAKRNSLQYHPPIPKQQPYLDYKGERITTKQLKDWQSEVTIWLPINILILTLLIFSTYNLYFK